MPKGSEELTLARKEEIIAACKSLYQVMNFKDIRIKDIADKTSFTRTSIYNYFQTKEEIFMALLQKEYEEWIEDLQMQWKDKTVLSKEGFAEILAHSLEKRTMMLKILSMNHYDMEDNTRLEKLVEFKVVYGKTMTTIAEGLTQFFPVMTEQDKQDFIFSFFPFLFGIYPYTIVTEKQKEAMKLAGVHYVYQSIYEITYTHVKKLL